MAIIYTYKVKKTPTLADLVLISDVEDSKQTKNVKLSGIKEALDVVDSVIATLPLEASSATGDVTLTLTKTTGTLYGGVDITQAAALQIGEAVLPTPTVDLLGENLIKQIIDKTNLGNPDKQIAKSDVNRYTPTPLNRSGTGGMMTLPPQVMSSGDQAMTSASGSLVPPFPVQAASSQGTRKIKSDIYGIA